jgi:hypothetical protein
MITTKSVRVLPPSRLIRFETNYTLTKYLILTSYSDVRPIVSSVIHNAAFRDLKLTWVVGLSKIENVTCKWDHRLRNRDVWFSVRGETETKQRALTKGLETDTSRPRLHPFCVLNQLFQLMAGCMARYTAVISFVMWSQVPACLCSLVSE